MLVTHASKDAVENYFDTSYELEALLEQRIKRQLLSEVQSICPPGVTIMNVRQPQRLGLGHAILCTRPILYNKPFIVVLPDVVLDVVTTCPLRYNLAAMIARFKKSGRSQVLTSRYPGIDLREYSVITTEQPLETEGQVSCIQSYVEKPDHPERYCSDLTAVGRYVLSADIWPVLEKTTPGAWGRIQLTDAISALNATQPVEAHLMTGKSFDCGRKLGYMKAFVTYGLHSHAQGQAFREDIKKILAR